MPYTNVGSQDISIQYGDNITDKSINRRFAGIVPVGIYEGLELTKTGSNEIEVAPGLVHIGDGKGNRVKIRVNSSVTVSPVDSSNEFVALQWEYRADEGWFARIDSFGAVSSHMILLGEALFSSGVIDDIDFRDRERITYEKGIRVRETFETHGARVVDPIIVDIDSFSVGLHGKSFGVKTSTIGSGSTVNLPTGTDLQHGREVEILDIEGGASGNNITISAGANETVMGGSSISITTDFGSKTVRYYQGVSEWIEV